MRIEVAVAIVVLSITTVPARAQRDFSKVEISATHVAGKVWMLEGAGGNIGVHAGDDGIVLIDDQFAPLAPKIEDAIAKISPSPLRFILNTHWHGDHTGGNEHFGKRAPLMSHHNVRTRLASELGSDDSRDSLPVLTFDEGLSIHLNGEEVRAIHLPNAHTDGDTILWFTRSGVVHMGDTFFAGRFPYVDRRSGGSVRGLIRQIERVLAMVPSDVVIIPGHGPLSTIDDLRTWLGMLRATVDAVEKAKLDGMTGEQMKEAAILDPWKSFDWSFIPAGRWIDTIVAELNEE